MLEELKTSASQSNLIRNDTHPTRQEHNFRVPRRIVKVRSLNNFILHATGQTQCSQFIHPELGTKNLTMKFPSQIHYVFSEHKKIIQHVELDDPKQFCMEVIQNIEIVCKNPKKPKKKAPKLTKDQKTRKLFLQYMQGKCLDAINYQNIARMLGCTRRKI